MREVLTLCIELDTIAYETYHAFAAACTDDRDLALVFANMAKEERQHVAWWSSLQEGFERGEVPDIVSHSDARQRIEQVATEVRAALPAGLDCLSVDEMLDLAARLEFFMLDPVFGELADLVSTTGRSPADTRDAYARHVMRLVDTIERRHSQAGLASFLARVLQRTFADQQRLSRLATHDELTGLYNRRGVLTHLDQWTAWSARYGRPLGVALIDVDRFKTINDECGHPTGDEALRVVAACIRGAVREADLVGRFGGDEFIVIAPEAGCGELETLTDRVVTGIRDAGIECTVPVTVSVGAATTAGGTAVAPAALVAAADRSLYAAKAAGRDRSGPVETVAGRQS